MRLLPSLVVLAFQLEAYAIQQTVLSHSSSPCPFQQEWDDLSTQLEGRLFSGVPLAEPCFTQEFNSKSCSDVRENYRNGIYRAKDPEAYMQTQWETCQKSGAQCLLNYLDLNDASPTAPPNKCEFGSIPPFYIDVRSEVDVQAAFQFSRRTKVPLVIKNTGHDFLGRSSAPQSLALWTHNLKKISYNPQFVAEGCSQAYPGVTMEAGVQWHEAYTFAEVHNITLVGGSDQSVGSIGGWLQGGGHGVLSNTMGLGVDRVLQYKVVTPDGKLRIANSCQNEDLFFALRGGGGGTFGVVLEATVLASPAVTMQTLIFSFTALDATLTKQLWTLLTDNALRWADEGWGGYSSGQQVTLANPTLSRAEAAVSLKPMIDFANKLISQGVKGTQLLVTEYTSFGAYFDEFAKTYLAKVGLSFALASRLIPRSSFKTSDSRRELVSALMASIAITPRVLILITAPSSYQPLPGPEGRTSVTGAWRDSVYHITTVSAWNWNATVQDKIGNYTAAIQSIENLRRITPDAAYFNEADVYEPNWQESFWGSNYHELLEIKKKYDPERLLDCWQCVGWQLTSPRYSCYLSV